MGTTSKCVSPSAAQPWWGLQGSLATALLLPLPPCSRRPGASLPVWPVLPHPCDMSWALTKAAPPVPSLLPILCLWVFIFSWPCSSAVWTHPHVGGICLCQLGARAVVTLQRHGCCSTRLGFLSSPPACHQLGDHSVLQHPSPCQTRPPLAISALVVPAPTSAPFPVLNP